MSIVRFRILRKLFGSAFFDKFLSIINCLSIESDGFSSGFNIHRRLVVVNDSFGDINIMLFARVNIKYQNVYCKFRSAIIANSFLKLTQFPLVLWVNHRIKFTFYGNFLLRNKLKMKILEHIWKCLNKSI